MHTDPNPGVAGIHENTAENAGSMARRNMQRARVDILHRAKRCVRCRESKVDGRAHGPHACVPACDRYDRHPAMTFMCRPPPMTVYVDDAVHAWRGQRWAHLLADTLDELHAFAARLGMPRRAFQDRTSGAHYDVTAAMRERAIAAVTS